jgi:hypothetical protein
MGIPGVRRGFTYLELFILILFLGVLWAICPAFHSGHFARLVRRSNDNATRAELTRMRAALAACVRGSKGRSPKDLSELTAGGRYLAAIPLAKTGVGHPPSAEVRIGTATDDRGGWMYDNVPGDPGYGRGWVDCVHTDTKGTAWDSY